MPIANFATIPNGPTCSSANRIAGDVNEENPASGPQVERQDRPTGGVYRVSIEGHIAEMTFSRASERLIIIDHTDVPEALRGRQVGNLLLERAIADARALDSAEGNVSFAAGSRRINVGHACLDLINKTENASRIVSEDR